MKRVATLFAAAGLILAAPLAWAGECDFSSDDVTGAAAALATEGHPLWNADMDFDGDGVITLVDVSQYAEQCGTGE